MKRLLLLLILTALSCSDVRDSNIKYLNGYWEIQNVINTNGTKIDFQSNNIYDFYKIDENKKGFYKKVIPQFDGSFITDNYLERIEIIQKNKLYKIRFKSDFDDRELTIIELSESKLIIKNADDKIYHYKKVLIRQ